MYGSVSPVSGVTLSSLVLEASNGTLTGAADGTIGSVPVAVTASVTRANRTNTVSLSITATDVSIAGIVAAVLPDDLVPDFLLDLLEPVQFSSVSLSYISTRRGRTPFALTAQPGPVPGLSDVLELVGLKPSDLALTTTPSGSVAFAAGKTISLDLGDPFEGPAIIAFSVGIAPLDRAAVLQGSFTCTINVDVFKEPLGLFVAAEARAAAGTSGVSLGLTGATTTPINIKGLDWVTFGTLEVSVAVSLSKGPAALESLKLAGSITLAGVTGTGVFLVRACPRWRAQRSAASSCIATGLLACVLAGWLVARSAAPAGLLAGLRAGLLASIPAYALASCKAPGPWQG